MPITNDAIKKYRLGLKDRLSTDIIQQLRRKSAGGRYGSEVARKVFEGIESEAEPVGTGFSALDPVSFPKLEDMTFPDVPGVVSKRITIEATVGKPSGSSARAVAAAMEGFEPKRTPAEIAKRAISAAASPASQPHGGNVSSKTEAFFSGAPIESSIQSPVIGLPAIPLAATPAPARDKAREPSAAISSLVSQPVPAESAPAHGPFPGRGPRIQPTNVIAEPTAPTWQDIYSANRQKVADLIGLVNEPARIAPVKDPLMERVNTIAMSVIGRPISGQDEYEAVMEYLRQSGAFDVFNRDVSDDAIAKAVRVGTTIAGYRNAAKSFLPFGS